MYLGQEYSVLGNWFKIHFTENYGMALGFQFAGKTGKIILSLFRIFAVIFISWYLYYLAIYRKVHRGLIYCLAMVLGGAIGNIIDSTFYSLLFSESGYSPSAVAQFLPNSGGYGNILQGKVVDMLYIPLVRGYLPEWLPFWGGDYFIFFRPVFNLADTAITIGVLLIFIFHKRFFN